MGRETPNVRIGDRIGFVYWGEIVWDTVTEVAVRCGLDREGNPVSDDDYVITELGHEVNYHDVVCVAD